MAKENNDASTGFRLGLTFHRTFPLVRSAVVDILKVADKEGGIKSSNSRKNIRSETNLGSIYIEAMPRYGMGSGLLLNTNTLSPFGFYALEHDPLLDQPTTQWLMHYHLSAPKGPGPVFWHELVKSRFKSGDEFTAQDIADQVGDIFEREEGKPLAERSARSTATIFLGTYTRSDSLGNLGLLEEVSTDRYRVLDPDPPFAWVVGYAFLHWWEAFVREQRTINLNELHGENGVTDIFMIGKGRMNSILEEMQQEGVLELYRVAPPYQIVLLRNDKELALRKMYGL